MSQSTNSSGIFFKVGHFVYADDGVFVFDKHTKTKKCIEHIHDDYNKIGFQMHAGKDKNDLKSEAVLISHSIEEHIANLYLPEKVAINQGRINF